VKPHPYGYPCTNVYRNKFDIRDATELDEIERDLSGDRLLTLRHDAPITVGGYRAVHRYLFQDVYEWAGQYRRVTTGRGAAAFCRAEFIEAVMSKRFGAINAEHDLRGLAADRFAARAAEHLNELNAIHPFLDGNGRTQRAFLEILAEQAGHEIDLARVDPTAWNRASIEGFYKLNHEPLREVIAGALFGGARRG